MRTMVVVAHPRRESFSHAMAAGVAEAVLASGASIDWHDLYAEGFDPVLPVEETMTSGSSALDRHEIGSPLLRAHRDHLAQADALVVAHPNWWGKPPAMMAGWLDRVLVPGVAYELDTRTGAPRPLLGLRHLLVLNTSDTPADREREVFGDPLDLIWRQCVGGYLGEAQIQRRMFGPMAEADATQRRAWLDEVGALARALAN
ncbi:NAD(P)H dehydrogenase (quinone) [Knoellia sinensis KCTC 19936]|uniref:NAD(P)H dehydrogenase (Quinone) n=1 Tax=Knoellia sinensis KCTC 19936 TaxID=1385520 RepID=A0A0A0JBY7_9MICO|nr:NAD(P)H-dependent oxidoreductase [Knoellia sinensis]KGN34324.1 NAD(P)H dehydrogenase (quinone) [Knoellia sinensis KCTC 19936]